MTEFTKGLWISINGGVFVKGEDDLIVNVGQQVADTWYFNTNQSTEQAEANAHLIAAAPRMYEALENVIAWGNDRNFSKECGTGKMLIEAQQALDMVEGK